jgi:DDE domain
MYLYRAVDKGGKTVDFYLSRRREVSAAKAFLRKAMKGQRIPTETSHRAVAHLKEKRGTVKSGAAPQQ